MSNTNSEKLNIVEWNQIPWKKIHKVVFKLQKRIYQAYRNGEVEKGRKLQKTLIKSYYNRLLSVRKVTQDNQGKKTAGVDRIKSLNPKQRLELAKNLTLGTKSKPIRRVWIPKPGNKTEMRPLGIPIMRDRAIQALVKSALEPEWESRFEPNSYGFRPGRSAHDAIAAIFNQIRYKSKYVLDADIAKCFDRINHNTLLAKLNTFPNLRRQIRAWLRSDICYFVNHERTQNRQGTPQGGVISPLLSNIALHGMESRVMQVKGASLIRYADDFVIMHEDLDKLQQCKQIIVEWLTQLDLELKDEKTQTVHTLHELDGKKPGFNFLGFNIRQYEVGKYQSGKTTHGGLLGFKTLIKPSKESVLRHYDKLSETIKTYNASTQLVLISKLAPIIRGWCNYYSSVVSKVTFSKLSHLMYLRLTRWGNRRHPNKSKTWVSKKYWTRVGNDNWVFGENTKIHLPKHSSIAIKRHVKIKGDKSPYDGDTLYWGKRLQEHPELSMTTSKLLKRQNGKCNWCGLSFKTDDLIETDHITPKSLGGNNTYNNLQLLHNHCHDTKTKGDGSLGTDTQPEKRGAV
ncbi:MAG: group II intron reverse transcriptase/maturase [Xenococcaceae cyanobacterium]